MPRKLLKGIDAILTKLETIYGPLFEANIPTAEKLDGKRSINKYR